MRAGELLSLEDRWRTTRRRRAVGGRYAVAGFHYQFLSTLLHAVERFVQDRGATAESVIGECLSDIRSIEGDSIVVCQVKRRHTARSTRAALDELWDVYQLADDMPHLQRSLRFQIQAASTGLADVRLVVDEWRSRLAHVPGIDGKQVTSFLGRLEVTTLADPARELHAVLHNELKAPDPVGQVRRWVARLLEAADNDHGFSIAARDIWNDLVGLRGRSLQGRDVRLWQDEYVPPRTTVRGGLLTGQRPMLHHLRDGFFAHRPLLVNEVGQDFYDWAESRPAFVNNSVQQPVFWISGRSGAGKSVLLLQLLARLHQDGTVRILWLGGSPHLLGRAVEWAAQARASDPASDLLSVIAIDDPYEVSASGDCTTQWQQMLDMVEDLRQKGDGDSLPLIVCAGPTEQAAQLGRDFLGDITLATSTLENENQFDYEQLRQWFIERTGQIPKPVIDVNLLLVQLFFEWQHGTSLREFAGRFRSRVAAMDPSGNILDVVAKVLAINRLYAGYPVDAFNNLLSAAQRDAVSTLQQEAHLAIRDSNTAREVWIAHPRIANTIYETWFPPQFNRNERTDHLREVAAGCRKFGRTSAAQMSPLWAISRALQDQSGELHSRIITEDLGELIAEIYSALTVTTSTPSLSDIAVWIELAATLPSNDWSPHPMNVATTHINNVHAHESGLRLTCHKLLQHAPASPGVSSSIIALLDRLPRWHEWTAVALDALRVLDDTALDSIIEKQINLHRRTKMVDVLLATALKRQGVTRDLVSLASRMLPDASTSFGWSSVGVSLLRRDRDVHRPRVLSWLRAHRQRREIVHLLIYWLKLDEPDYVHNELVHIARHWLTHNRFDAMATIVLDHLLQTLPSSDDILHVTTEWLGLDTSNQGQIVQRLVRQHRQVDRGIRWLRDNPMSDPSWPLVFEALLETVADDPTEPDGGDQEKENISPIDDFRSQRTSLGLAWLASNSHNRRWPYVWNAMCDAFPDTEELDECGHEWLTSSSVSRHGWHNVWSRLWRTGHGPNWLPQLALSKLKDAQQLDDATRGRWCRIWHELWDTSLENRDQLSSVALTWLATAPLTAKWRNICESLAEHRTITTQLQVLITTQFRDISLSHPQWGYIWTLAWNLSSDKTGLHQQALDWLGANMNPTKIWAAVWYRLWELDTDVEQLWNLAMVHLRANRTSRSFPDILLSFWEIGSEREDLRELARQWVASVPPHQNGWQVVRDLVYGEDLNSA